ncbi:UNVERIFIED_CONTAM: hypothetical protein K2H54_026764 [Gekko kuhli]
MDTVPFQCLLARLKFSFLRCFHRSPPPPSPSLPPFWHSDESSVIRLVPPPSLPEGCLSPRSEEKGAESTVSKTAVFEMKHLSSKSDVVDGIERLFLPLIFSCLGGPTRKRVQGLPVPFDSFGLLCGFPKPPLSGSLELQDIRGGSALAAPSVKARTFG